jgi:hypothetical protein
VNVGVVVRSGREIIPQVWRADSAWSRMRGLLGRPQLAANALQALWLAPCNNVHTIGMRYPLDIVFLDRGGRVLDYCENVSPWRMRWCRAARHTVEFAPGAVAALAIEIGELWEWQARSGA